MQFKNYSAEKIKIDSVTSDLTFEERLLRQYLIRQIINNDRPVIVEKLKDAPEMAHIDIDKIILKLVDKRRIVLDEQGQIIFVYPVSALPTHHKVTLQDGRKLNAMCGIDAMGVAFTLGQDTVIQSECSLCGQSVTVKITDGVLTMVEPESLHVLHVDLNKVDNWAGSC
ncbi:MAG: hypothetical protein H6Q68_1721 [Firmicutes bacterium]|nr:hypothetical protein [Bacillota bacterium]